MREQVFESIVGLIVLIVAGLFVFYAIDTVGEGDGAGDYTLTAKFGSIGGIDTGADIRMAGVKIGVVRDISLDTTTFDARVQLSIHAGVPVPEDSSARITTDGLLGAGYIAIEPGAEEILLSEGEEFTYTQGSVDLLNLLGQFAGGSANQDGE